MCSPALVRMPASDGAHALGGSGRSSSDRQISNQSPGFGFDIGLSFLSLGRICHTSICKIGSCGC